MTKIDPATQCKICGIQKPVMLPCGISPRIYVGEWGHILGAIDGCPYERKREPDWVPVDIIPRMALYLRAVINERGKELANAKNYQSLWAARNGQNYHLNFDAKRRLGVWQAAYPSGINNPHQSRVRRSKGQGG